ncbi:MAG: transposase, partial [Acidimicrobiales bacterium]
GIRTVISDPVKNRRLDKLSAQDAKAVSAARRSARSESGKQLLKKRGMHLERSFAHLLDAGGARRTTLRGLENLNKRFKLAAAIYNLSQLMREIWGVGTPKQWAAGAKALVGILCRLWVAGWSGLVNAAMGWIADSNRQWDQSRPPLARWVQNTVANFLPADFSDLKKVVTSTGC